MPNRTSAEEIRHDRNTPKELAEEAGRDPNSIAILAFGHAGHFQSKAQVQELEEAGANRVTLWLEQTQGDGALSEMEAIARQVL